MITLYDLPASGNCYRVRLMLALTGVRYRRIAVDLERGDSMTEISRFNGLREVPVLTDDTVILRDSSAILAYLAIKFAPEWLPVSAVGLGSVQQWLSFAANEIQNGPRFARAVNLGLIKGDYESYMSRTRRVLVFLNAYLEGRAWLYAEKPTIADVACHPYICNIGEAGVAIDDYPHLAGWLSRLAGLTGYIRFDGNS